MGTDNRLSWLPVGALLPRGPRRVYILLLFAGDKLLNDPDALWQITVRQWILDHRAVPETDVYSFTPAPPALDLDARAGAGILRHGPCGWPPWDLEMLRYS